MDIPDSEPGRSAYKTVLKTLTSSQRYYLGLPGLTDSDEEADGSDAIEMALLSIDRVFDMVETRLDSVHDGVAAKLINASSSVLAQVWQDQYGAFRLFQAEWFKSAPPTVDTPMNDHVFLEAMRYDCKVVKSSLDEMYRTVDRAENPVERQLLNSVRDQDNEEEPAGMNSGKDPDASVIRSWSMNTMSDELEEDVEQLGETESAERDEDVDQLEMPFRLYQIQTATEILNQTLADWIRYREVAASNDEQSNSGASSLPHLTTEMNFDRASLKAHLRSKHPEISATEADVLVRLASSVAAPGKRPECPLCVQAAFEG
ncbi:unnamed protein product [Zymoseptoria tritici ST99CH_1E4]|uniref:Uncharacterized protein n=1 Tax=Zymoseptoria tritici ST99CH_1E4 TaxID=1276532 RepID=A0A2H1FY84_ZYMTR|nr:unnamed protein product [Zymoseptoria tritici ST99CH_1E4]